MRTSAIVVAALLGACNGPSFDSPSRVLGPRLLAVVAEPPETAPGVDVTFTPFVALLEGATYEWTIDLSPRALAAAAGQDLFEAREPIVFDGTIRGAETQAAIGELLGLIGDAASGTPEHVVRFVYEEVGLIVSAHVVVRDADGVLIVEGVKRVNLTPRAGPTTNPPPPRLRVGERWASARGADPTRCEPEGEPLEVAAGELVVLAPEPDEPWLETYPALDLDGRRVDGVENAYYSWFSAAGDFEFNVTRAPEQEVEWTAPATPGEYPMWLVVRDGHLGTSRCSTSVRVTP